MVGHLVNLLGKSCLFLVSSALRESHTLAILQVPSSFENVRIGNEILKRFMASSSSFSGPIELSTKAKSIPENIWVRTVNLVQKHNPINLGQGFPDFDVPEVLSKALVETQEGNNAMKNQYTRGQGHPRFVRALAEIYSPFFSRAIDPMKEIIVTVGGYESLFCIMNSTIESGDEVVLIEPFFDCYAPMVRLCGGVPKFVPLKLEPGGKSSADFRFDKDEMANAFTTKTKAVIVNTPHNPTGKVFTRDEIEFIANLCKKHNSLYISDEVYEWLVYEGGKHFRAATLPGMWERTVTVCSAGKTFNITGWKIGWTIGPEYLISGCMKIHSESIYTCGTPLQEALAVMFEHEQGLLGTEKSYWKCLHDILLAKREKMYNIAIEAGLRPVKPEGGYFMVADVSALGIDIPANGSSLHYDERVAEWLIKEKGLAVIPVSVFLSTNYKSKADTYIRFCFIKNDQVLDAAAEKLKALAL